MNVIFGSGVIGLLARLILGPEWKIVPFYRSRFFSYNPSLCDNFLICDGRLDQFVKDITKELILAKYDYKLAWSVSGHLLKDYNKDLCGDWLLKIFGNNQPSQAEAYISKHFEFQVYNVRLNDIYNNILKLFIDDLRSEAAKGPVSKIGDHYFIRNGIREDFNNAICTIPLSHTLTLLGSALKLPAKTLHYLHVETGALNFEGTNQVLVVDNSFSFYKVTNIAPKRYLFYFGEEVQHPGVYLSAFMNEFDILDGTSIENALPIGDTPKMDLLDKYGIYCIGSFAQWDWTLDVGSCLIRIMKYSQQDCKQASQMVT